MLADKQSALVNEPLLSRHARYMHALAQRAVRATFMKDFDPVVAADILTPAHKRRALDVTSMPRSELTREIAIEEMRRDINIAFANRVSKVLMATAIGIAVVTFLAYGLLWANSDALRATFLEARGFKEQTPREVVIERSKETLSKGAETMRRMREAVRRKLEEMDRKSAPAAPTSQAPSWMGQLVIARSFLPAILTQSAAPGGASTAPDPRGVAIDPDDVSGTRKRVEEIAKRIALARAAAFKKAFEIVDGKKKGQK